MIECGNSSISPLADEHIGIIVPPIRGGHLRGRGRRPYAVQVLRIRLTLYDEEVETE